VPLSIEAGRLLRAFLAGTVLSALCAGMACAQDVPHSGDPFAMTETDLLFVHHPELKGATIDGHLEDVVAASPTRKASMNVIFDDIRFADGRTEPISVVVKNMSALEPKTHHVRDIGIIVGSAVGHVVSKKTGVGGGTLAGAAAGFALVSAMKSETSGSNPGRS
jgi:hypothetical protein